MIAQGGGGVIINISSLNSTQPGEASSAYCSAKAGVNMLTRVAAMDLGPEKIRVCAIAPGLIDTPATAPIKDIPQILNAYLGTCVGVTLNDRKANVGGLIHLLLPEPTGGNTFGKPENYALTGLPIFLRTLCNEGAELERLEATIAGGALVGPLSDMDLDLDIGGRTAEIVETMLNQENIPIRNRETGGFFSCQLNLDLKTWFSYIEPIPAPQNGNDIEFTSTASILFL